MRQILVAVTLLFVLGARVDNADAKGIPIVYNTGQHAFATGPLPAPYDSVAELAGYQAGYMCDIKGILWSYFSVKNCKPVAFKGDTYSDESSLVAAIKAKYPEDTMQRGLWGRFGWMLLALGVLVGAALWLKDAMTGQSDDEESEAPQGAVPAADPGHR